MPIPSEGLPTILNILTIKCSEKLEMADLIELVYRYSREIEHSDENLDRVEELDWFIRI